MRHDPGPAAAWPVSDEELIESYRQGWAAAVDSLLTRYRHLAWTKARSYFLTGGDEDDLVQEGMIGLYKAIRDFDPDRQVSFRSFAAVCITRHIVTAIRATQRHKHLPLNCGLSLSKPLACGDGVGGSLLDELPSPETADPVETIISQEEVRRIEVGLSEILSAFEAEVLRQLTEGYSYQEIAVRLGRQAKSVDNALQRIKRKASRYLGTGRPA